MNNNKDTTKQMIATRENIKLSFGVLFLDIDLSVNTQPITKNKNPISIDLGYKNISFIYPIQIYFLKDLLRRMGLVIPDRPDQI